MISKGPRTRRRVIGGESSAEPDQILADRQRITDALVGISTGAASPDTLLPLIYDDLRRLAQHYMANERKDHTREATSLVHEVYLRLVEQDRVDWRNRAHFFAVAAQALRRILIDHARRKARPKHGGPHKKLSLDDALTVAADQPNTDLVSLDRALVKLAKEEPEVARVVELRFFGGLTNEEAAEVLASSSRTVRRRWEYARAWLYRELTAAD